MKRLKKIIILICLFGCISLIININLSERSDHKAASIDRLSRIIQNKLFRTATNVLNIEKNQKAQLNTSVPKQNITIAQSVNTSKCETIDLAVICTDQQDARDAIVLVKGILLTTQSPVHFHFVTTALTRLILQRLFETWQLHGCFTSFYSIERLQEKLKWVAYEYDLTSFTILGLPWILPSTLKQIVLLDTRVIVTSDISTVWTVSKSSTTFGLVDSGTTVAKGTPDERRDGLQKNKYLKTGALLINLNISRSLDWVDVLSSLIEGTNNTQDNTAITGLKLDQVTKTRQTLQNHEYYHKEYRRLLYYSGALLRRGENNPCLVNTTANNSQLKKADKCSGFKTRQAYVHRTHLYYTDCRYQSTNNKDVTLVTQLSIERIQIIERIFQLWDGPASVALYFSDSDMETFMTVYNSSAVFKHRQNICFHVVYRDTKSYPINYIRNVALDQVQTDYIFLIDVDFLPSYRLHTYLIEAVTTMDMNKTVLIVPGFESLSNQTIFPKLKNDLISLWNKEKILQVKVRSWNVGHAAVNYTKWRTATTAYNVNYQEHFEPFLVFHKDTPRFDERFIDYGWDKVSHAMLLDAQRYKFVVLPSPFIIHMPHPVSEFSKVFKKDTTFKTCWAKLKSIFMAELKKKYTYSVPRRR